MDDIGKSKKDIIVGNIASHVLAGVTGFVGLLAWFKLRTVQSVLVVIGDVTTWAWRFIDMASFMIFGIIWLIVVLFSQHYYQKGYEKNRLWRNFNLLTGIMFFILAMSTTTIMVAMPVERTQANAVTLAIEAACAVVLIAVHIWLRLKEKKISVQ